MFESLSQKFRLIIESTARKGSLTQHDVDIALKGFKNALIEADVALVVVKKFISNVRAQLNEGDVLRRLDPQQYVTKVVYDELVAILTGEQVKHSHEGSPRIVLLVGLQGVGKTTLAGKLGLHFAEERNGEGKVLLIAADLRRPNAVTQLQIIARKAGIEVYPPANENFDEETFRSRDVLQVVEEGLDYAKRENYKTVIVDTSGRTTVSNDSMEELEKIHELCIPSDTFLVVDGLSGQDAANTATSFHKTVPLTGVVLTKLDGDSRGGAALSIAGVAEGLPIVYISTGEKLDDFEKFHPDRIASRILDLGDALTLIEELEKLYEKEQVSGERNNENFETFTLDDFLTQLTLLHRSGKISRLVSFLPGLGDYREQIRNVDSKSVGRVLGVLQSMTAEERRNPKILNSSRKLRIAKGAGVPVSEVNSLMERFFEAKKLMMVQSKNYSRIANKKSKTRKKKGKGAVRSGNPAKRAQLK